MNVKSILFMAGGPSGSYAASVLAREGISVVVLEAAKFPRCAFLPQGPPYNTCQTHYTHRYHIGESLLPSVRGYLRFIGAEEKVAKYGFTRKVRSLEYSTLWPGPRFTLCRSSLAELSGLITTSRKHVSIFPLNSLRHSLMIGPTDTDFVSIGQENSSWNVVRVLQLHICVSILRTHSFVFQVRSEFDELLLNHARSCGASVFEQTKATAVKFEYANDSGIKKPTSVSWALTPPGRGQASCKDTSNTAIRGTTSFKYLIDTSGRAGLMSTKYLNNRHFNQALKNIAIWGYWENVGSYGVGTPREGAPYFEALLGKWLE